MINIEKKALISLLVIAPMFILAIASIVTYYFYSKRKKVKPQIQLNISNESGSLADTLYNQSLGANTIHHVNRTKTETELLEIDRTSNKFISEIFSNYCRMDYKQLFVLQIDSSSINNQYKAYKELSIDGDTALHIAMRCIPLSICGEQIMHYVTFIKNLLANGADANIQNHENQTPLDVLNSKYGLPKKIKDTLTNVLNSHTKTTSLSDPSISTNKQGIKK